MTVVPEPKRVKFAVTWDDDCEQIIIEHPMPPNQVQHVHHNRLAIIKKSANSITIEPMTLNPGEVKVGHDQRCTYVRTNDKGTEGRAIFRQGVAV